MFRLSLFLIFILIPVVSYPQDAPVKFGEIDRDALEMQTYEGDTSAHAVILCDYGIFSAFNENFTRVLRIKILKKEGLEWANRAYISRSKARIKGITYNLVNNEIVEDKLDRKTIYAEKLNGIYYRMKVAMPNVQVGSVMDIEFSFEGFPSEWYFQHSIPVIWSELVLEETPSVSFQKNFFGYETIDISTPTRWVATNVPAFHEEPYMDAATNYRTKFEFDVAQFKIGQIKYSIAPDWETICSNLFLFRDFGGAIEQSFFMKNIAEEIKAMDISAEGKIRMAFAEAKKVKWDGSHSLFARDETVKYAYDEQIGNSAEVNMILLQILQRMDMDAHPVVMSTRDNGVLTPINCSFNKLNHMIVYVNVDQKIYLLDATEEYMPCDLLPLHSINKRGRVIARDRSAWVDIEVDKKEKSQIYYKLALDENMNLEGALNYRSYDYAAFNLRKEYFSFNSEDEYLDGFESKMPGLDIQRAEFTNLDSIYKPLTRNFEIQVRNQVMQAGNEYYLYPLLYEQLTENPFKSDERKYPVDFAYPREKSVIIQIQIPEGFEASSLPEPVSLYLPEHTVDFSYQVALSGNTLTAIYKFNINKAVFLPNEYPDLKLIYDQVIKHHSQPVILKKSI